MGNKVTTIQMYVSEQLEDLESTELIRILGVSLSMLSAYKKSYKPSLEVAINVYKHDGTVLHPYAEDSLKLEIGED